MESQDLIEIIKRVHQGSLKATMELDNYVSKYEPFYQESFAGKNASYPMIDPERPEAPIHPIPITTIKRIENIVGAIDANYVSRPFVRHNDGSWQVYIWIGFGNNGSGDFVNDDLVRFKETMDYLTSHTKWVSMTQAERDIIDDLSYWGITFIV